MNVPDDDGMVLPVTVATLKKMATNLAPFARVCDLRVAHYRLNIASSRKSTMKTF
jgi:hypothetical protein